VDETAVLKLVRRAADKAAVSLSFHAEIEKALETYDLQRADVLHILTSAERAIADGARAGIWTIVGAVMTDIANDETQNRRWAAVVDIEGDDVFVRTVHGWPRGDE
jgi:hypothetical protein